MLVNICLSYARSITGERYSLDTAGKAAPASSLPGSHTSTLGQHVLFILSRESTTLLMRCLPVPCMGVISLMNLRDLLEKSLEEGELPLTRNFMTMQHYVPYSQEQLLVLSLLVLHS